ncbi:MAG: N-acetyltransferase [Acidobacteria bacterium]|nr:N-acetyltransferase [Acidobacteriota bacterium]
MMPHSNRALVRRLEAAHAACGRASAGEAEAIAGGWAIFAGLDSPLTQALGLGLEGAVSAREFDRLEEFFRSRGAKAAIDLCPLADLSLIELLGARGYRLAEFNNVLARPIAPGEWIPPPPAGIEVRPARIEEAGLWTLNLVRGFFHREEATPEELALCRALFASAGPYIVRAGALAAGGGGMTIHERVATLAGDATPPEGRGRGVQTALIRGRLRDAQSAGCDLAWAAVLPGSVSERNYARCGFRPVYTRAMMVREF